MDILILEMNQIDSKQDSSKTSSVISHRKFRQSAFTTSLRDRPVVFNSQHIDDLNRKSIHCINERKLLRFDEGSLQMTNDPNSVFYRRLSQLLKSNRLTEAHANEEMEKLKSFEKYGPELVEFIKDREGRLKSKFDKVFII